MASSFNADRVNFGFVHSFAARQALSAQVGLVIQNPGAESFTVGGAAMGGTAATLGRTATSVTPIDAFSFESTYAHLHRVIPHVLPMDTLQTDYALEKAGRDVAESIMADMDATFFAGLESLPSLAHPRAGAGAGQVGAGLKFCDTGLAYLQGEAGAGTQDNMLTSALSEAALLSALKLLANYKSDRGTPLHLGMGGPLTLVVAPKNMAVAHELTKSLLSGADMQSNYFNGLQINTVVYPLATDDDDWVLIDPARAPIGMSISKAPTMRVSVTTNGLFAEFTAEWSGAFFAAPYEQGIVFGNVD